MRAYQYLSPLLKSLLTSFFVLGLLMPVNAQNRQKKSNVPATKIEKKALHHEVYDIWKEIPEQAISDNGQYTAFVISPQQGDGVLYINKSDGNGVVSKIDRGTDVRFTGDSQYAIFKIKPEFGKVQAAKRAKKKKEEMPQDSLGLISLQTGVVTKWPSVVSYRIPEKGSSRIAFLKTDSSKPAAASDSTAKKSTKARKEGEENGYTLVVKQLVNGEETSYLFVKEYAFNKSGSKLVFTSTGSEKDKDAGVFVLDDAATSPKKILDGLSKQSFTKLAFDEAGTQLAFIADLDTNSKTQIRSPKLGYWKDGQAQTSWKVDEANQPGGKGWLLNADYTPNFSKNGAVLYYGINPTPIVPDTTLLPEEIVNVEIWHWQDPKLQTQQKVSFQTDKKRAFLAALHLSDGKSVQLANDPMQAATLVDEGNAPYVLLTDPSNYSHEHWDWNPKSDVYLVEVASGAKKQIKETLQGRANASPKGRYIYWFSNPDTAWMAYDVDKGTLAQLTHNNLVRFADELDDHPDFPNSYGIAGWTTQDTHVLIYDRFDIWMVDPLRPDEKIKLTNGREAGIRYRYIRLDTEERNIDLSKPVMLRSFNEQTKNEGLYTYNFTNKTLTLKHEGAFRIGPILKKAKHAEKLLFTKETFRDFPDWYLTDMAFEKTDKVTSANPQQSDYNWGSVELVKWNAGDGTPLTGLLYKPDNFDPTQQYPMMTYFYEKNADNLHMHFAPKPIRSYLNFSYFTSNDYVVFVPDIVYQTGYPGESAYNCVIPGVLSMLEKGFINKNRLGISGHSWGGYQTAYLITRTNLFRAAEAGAPVSNMTSAYGGIRWDTGLVRQAQYERTQSRIGGTLWEKPMQYIENSPLFFADKVHTPLLMMHNDEDGAVPWYQGIEYYLALKRLQKPVWMLNYTGEKHGLTKRQNMKDFATRLYQFFDHYLKDTAAPRWMATGVPYLEKGIELGLEPATADETSSN